MRLEFRLILECRGPRQRFGEQPLRVCVAQALGIDLDGGIGRMELATLRRGLIRARNVAVPAELRADEVTARAIVRGYSRGDLDTALTRLQELVSAAQRLGATHILWS